MEINEIIIRKVDNGFTVKVEGREVKEGFSPMFYKTFIALDLTEVQNILVKYFV